MATYLSRMHEVVIVWRMPGALRPKPRVLRRIVRHDDWRFRRVAQGRIRVRAVNVRPAESRDVAFMAAMLVEAAFPPWTDPKPMPDEALANPHSARYLRSWGRAGDLGVIAEDESGAIGAAWCRLLPASEPGYGFVAEDVPEIAMAVVPKHRGEGVGQQLLTALIEDASSHGVRALSLSVHVLNPVALHTYERAGFVRVGGTDTVRVMLLTLPVGRLPRQP